MATQPQAQNQQPEPEGPGPVIDIGIFISALVGIYGVILLVYGAFGSPDNHKSLGHPFDLWWGAVMLGVALVMMLAALLGKRAARRSGTAGDEPPQQAGAGQ